MSIANVQGLLRTIQNPTTSECSILHGLNICESNPGWMASNCPDMCNQAIEPTFETFGMSNGFNLWLMLSIILLLAMLVSITWQRS